MHEEVVKLDQDFGATFSGVLTDDEGRVRALWGSYAEQVGSGRLASRSFWGHPGEGSSNMARLQQLTPPLQGQYQGCCWLQGCQHVDASVCWCLLAFESCAVCSHPQGL